MRTKERLRERERRRCECGGGAACAAGREEKETSAFSHISLSNEPRLSGEPCLAAAAYTKQRNRQKIQRYMDLKGPKAARTWLKL